MGLAVSVVKAAMEEKVVTARVAIVMLGASGKVGRVAPPEMAAKAEMAVKAGMAAKAVLEDLS